MEEATPTTAPESQPVTQQSSSLLQPPAWTPPEKYMVTTADGQTDWQAVAQKVGKSYSELEKAFSSRPTPPKDVAGYKAEIEGVDWAEYSANPESQAFMSRALEKGFTNDQLGFALNEFRQAVGAMQTGAEFSSVDAAAETLKKAWGNDFDAKIGNAWSATNAIAQATGVSLSEIESAGLGNNPTFLRIVAELNGTFAEDVSINTSGGAVSQDDIPTLIKSEAYNNSKHPDHAITSKKVKAYFESKYK